MGTLMAVKKNTKINTNVNQLLGFGLLMIFFYLER